MTEKDVAKIRSEYEASGISQFLFEEALIKRGCILADIAAPWLSKGTWNEKNYRIATIHVETQEIIAASGISLRAARAACLNAIDEKIVSGEKRLPNDDEEQPSELTERL